MGIRRVDLKRKIIEKSVIYIRKKLCCTGYGSPRSRSTPKQLSYATGRVDHVDVLQQNEMRIRDTDLKKVASLVGGPLFGAAGPSLPHTTVEAIARSFLFKLKSPDLRVV